MDFVDYSFDGNIHVGTIMRFIREEAERDQTD